jgi:hypothetical protein
MYFASFLAMGLSLVAQAAGDKLFLTKSARKFWLPNLLTLGVLIAIPTFWFGVGFNVAWVPQTNKSFYVFVILSILALCIYAKRQLSEDK